MTRDSEVGLQASYIRLQLCIFLDPHMYKFETKKLLTSWLNLKGGEGFSSFRT